ncbi:MAG TPA: phosphotransferase [Streptosporangiales bacterium]
MTTHDRAGGATVAEPRVYRSPLRDLLSAPGTRVVLLDRSRDPNAAVTVLVTPQGANEPELAVKIATTPVAAEVIEREARLLVELSRRKLRRVRHTLPRHAGVYDADGMLAVAAAVLPGVPMITRYHAYRRLARAEAVREDLAAAATWLAELHADTAQERAPVALVPGDVEDGELAAALRPITARLATATTPRTVVHGDFWAGNVLVTGDVVTGVVDWAAAELSGEPLRDVARFALSYALYLDRHTPAGWRVAGHRGLRADRWGAGVEYVLTGHGWLPDLVREFVTAALHRLGAPEALWREVLLSGIAEVAVTADHPEFARRHRDLLLRLVR